MSRKSLNELSNALLRRYERKAKVRKQQHQDAEDFHGRRSMDHLFKSVSGPAEYQGRHERASNAHNAESLKQRRKAEKRTRGLANAKAALAKQLKTRLTVKGSLGTRRRKSAQRLNNSFDPRDSMLRQLLEGAVKFRNKKNKRTWEELSGRLHKAFLDPQLSSKQEYENYQDDHYNHHDEKYPTGRGDAPKAYQNTGDSLKHGKGRYSKKSIISWPPRSDELKQRARNYIARQRQSGKPVLPGSPDYAQRAKASMDKRMSTLRPDSGWRPKNFISYEKRGFNPRTRFDKYLKNSFDPRNPILRQLLEGEVKRRNKASRRAWEADVERLHPDFVDYPRYSDPKSINARLDYHYRKMNSRRGREDSPNRYKDTGDSLKYGKDRYNPKNKRWQGYDAKTAARSSIKRERYQRPILPGSPNYAQRVKARNTLENSFDPMTNHIQTLFAEHGDLSEEFITQATALFEAAVEAKVHDLREQIEQDAAETTAVFLEDYCNDLVEDVDQYLTYVSSQLLEQQTPDDSATEETHTVMESMADEINTLSEHAEVVAHEAQSMQEEVETLQEMVTEQSLVIRRLTAALEEAHRKNIVMEAAFDLTVADTEKLTALVEEVEFENPAAFTEKVHIIKQRVFAVQPSVETDFHQPMDEAHPLTEEVSPVIEAYAKMLSR